MQPSEQRIERLSGELKDLPLADFSEAEQAEDVKGGATPDATAQVKSPRDAASGLATGKRDHSPL